MTGADRTLLPARRIGAVFWRCRARGVNGWRRLVSRLRRPVWRNGSAAALEPLGSLARLPGSEADIRPHLLVIVPWLPVGGAEMLLADILGGLQSGWRMSIVTTEPDDHALMSTFTAITRDVHHLPDLLARRHWLEFVAALLSSRGSKAILSSGSRFLYANLKAIKARFPDLQTFDILHNDAPEAHLASALGARRSIDHLIAVSERIGRSLLDGGAATHSVVVIPNGIDYEGTFNPELTDRQAARDRFGIDDTAFVIGFAGRMSEEKRPLAFLALAAPILAAHPNARLLVVGDGPMRAAFQDAARFAGIACRMQHISRFERATMPCFYAALDVLAVTSRIEGTPLAMLEALAMNCPVATTDVGDASLVIRDGVNGFVVPAATPQALGPLVAGLANDKPSLERMRAAARASVIQAGRSADVMLGSYSALINRPAKR